MLLLAIEIQKCPLKMTLKQKNVLKNAEKNAEKKKFSFNNIESRFKS